MKRSCASFNVLPARAASKMRLHSPIHTWSHIHKCIKCAPARLAREQSQSGSLPSHLLWPNSLRSRSHLMQTHITHSPCRYLKDPSPDAALICNSSLGRGELAGWASPPAVRAVNSCNSRREASGRLGDGW